MGVSLSEDLKDTKLDKVEFIYSSRTNCLDFKNLLEIAPNLKVFELPDIENEVPKIEISMLRTFIFLLIKCPFSK